MKQYEMVMDRAMQQLRPALRPVFEKEVLHYGILYFLQREGYLQHVVFMGGTALRLCHGALRFSEDLDFAGGKDYTPVLFREMAAGLKAYIESVYELPVEVKSSKFLALDGVSAGKHDGITVDKWVVTVITAAQRKDLPRQKIKIELANVPAYEMEYRPVRVHYQGLTQGENILVPVESKSEILADKLLSLPVASYPRYRDIWDISWLLQQGAQGNADLLQQKLADYGISEEQYRQCVQQRLSSLNALIHDGRMLQEMSRFLDDKGLAMMQDARYRQYLETEIREQLQQAINKKIFL